MTIESEIKKPFPEVFRRLYIKRRQTNGEYESDWVQIEDRYIRKFGKVDFGLDDIKVNFYKYSGLNFTIENVDGYFSDESDNKSIFFGYLNRYRSLVKLEAGYVDSSDNELPTDPSLFIGIMDESLVYKENNLISYKCNHLSRIFEEFPAANITGLGTTQTAKSIIEKIRDHQDSSNTAIFQKFITSSGWYITSSSRTYNMGTTTVLENMSCWKLIRTLAESEDHLSYIDRVGDFYFVEKTATSEVYHFSGVGEAAPTLGVNIVGNISVDENIKQVYNRAVITYDSNSSQLVNQEVWNWGDSSSSFRYGVRTYEYENVFMGATTASNVADDIVTNFSEPRKQIKFKAKFVPHLNVYDYVTLTYKTITKSGNYLWNVVNWGEGFWGKRSGYNINEDDTPCYIEKIKHSVDNFTSELVLKEIV